MSRNRIKNYTIKGQEIIIPKETTIEDIRLIINETKGVVICSSMQKDNVTLTTITDPIAGTTETSIGVDTSICELSSTDKLTIECDYGDDNAKEETLLDVKNAVENIDFTPIEEKIDSIDLSAVENKVQEESAAIQEKIDNIKLPEIDTSAIAKQGDNPEATMSAVYEAIGNVQTALTAINDTLGTL